MPTGDNGQRRQSWKVVTAALATGAALLSGGQVLAPAPALATEAEDSGNKVCQPGTFWIDQFGCVAEENGGGDPAQAGGELACDEQGIFCVSGTAPKRACDDPSVICVSLGDDRKPRRDHDNSKVNDGGKRAGFTRASGAEARLPKKQRRTAEQEMAHEKACEPLRDRIAELRSAATDWAISGQEWRREGRPDIGALQQAVAQTIRANAQLLLPKLKRKGCSSGRSLSPQDDDEEV
jgi:hypothetical protein